MGLDHIFIYLFNRIWEQFICTYTHTHTHARARARI